MFEIMIDDHNDVKLTGRFDASQTESAKEVFQKLIISTQVDFKNHIKTSIPEYFPYMIIHIN